MSHRREVAREADEPRLVDTRGVHAGDEQDAALRGAQAADRRARAACRRATASSRAAVTVTVDSHRATVRAVPCMPAAWTTNAAPARVASTRDPARHDHAHRDHDDQSPARGQPPCPGKGAVPFCSG